MGLAEPANEESREEKSAAPGMLDKWMVGREDWKGYTWWRFRQFGFASFRYRMSLRHLDGERLLENVIQRPGSEDG